MKSCLSALILTLIYALIGCSSGTSSDEELVSIDGVWRSASYISAGAVGEAVWLFENGSFTKTIEYTNGTISNAGHGVYSVGPSISMPSGLTANKLDITYVYEDDSTLTKLDVIYIDSQIMYLGNENINEACEGEYYQVDRFNIEVVNGTIRNLDEITVCLSRPTSLNFDLPHQLN